MATRQPPGDPRLLARLSGEAGVAPIVPMPRAGLPAWALVVAAVLAGLLLFAWLDARRREPPSAPAISPRAADALGTPVPPPPLYIPPEVAPPAPAPVVVVPPPAPAPAPPVQPRVVYVPQPVAPLPAPAVPMPPPRVANEPTLVVDTGAPPPAPAAAAQTSGGSGTPTPVTVTGSTAVPRVRAGVFANRSTTVPQGTLIPAVLETALDSTRAGFARAIVSRDVRGFDGTRVLIPRGSRLIGEYQSQVSPGQHRALVNWVRLIRPDGVTMAIGSPASDTLGRGGIGAHVNTHFFERFAGAILQSALDVGVNLATAAGGGSVIVALPGFQGQAGQIIQPAQITPTLTVRQGTSISIFVARDLDFTGAENRR